MINYIVQVVLFQVLFLAVYDLFLNRETFFKWNRVYLIATPILSFIIPLLKFDVFKNSVPQEYIVMLPEVVLNPQVVIEQVSNGTETNNYLMLIFIFGVALFSILFLVKLSKLINIIVSNKVIQADNYKLVLLEEKQSAFSFFNYIFINQNLKEKKGKEIIQHELVHCKHLHSLDLIFFEFFKIAMWFNPLAYIYQKRITLLHEFISDAEVVKETDKKSYFNQLLSETFDVENILFINQFYKHSLIKKRIAMITKKQSNKLKTLKYLLLIPLLGGMLTYSSCEKNEIVPSEVSEEKLSFPNGDEPLIMVDGEEVSLEFINNLSPKKIYSMNVLKGESAIEEYGKKASNGAIEIVLKKEQIIEVREDSQRNSEDVPYAIIEEPPVFPGCEGSKAELKSCLNKELQRHVAKKFNADLAGDLGLEPGKKKIYIQFKILKDGGVEIMGARAPHLKLEMEARRVVHLLPKMTPGKQRGKPVDVTYMLPISFNVEGDVDPSKKYTEEKKLPTSVTVEERK